MPRTLLAPYPRGISELTPCVRYLRLSELPKRPLCRAILARRRGGGELDRVYTHLLVEDLRSAINSIAPKRLRLSPLGCADTPCTGRARSCASSQCHPDRASRLGCLSAASVQT